MQSPETPRGNQSLPLPLPPDATQRLVLVALRRMAAHGIDDASVVLLFLRSFGIRFRKPLILLRAFVVELAQASRRTIRLAPCCAMGMTGDEARLVGILAVAASNRATAAAHLAALAGHGGIGHPLSTAAAFNDCLADLSRPLAI